MMNLTTFASFKIGDKSAKIGDNYENTRCAWAGGTTEFLRIIDRICWSCFFVLCFMSHRFHIRCFSVVLKYITYAHTRMVSAMSLMGA
jgi:hypothetical protein